MTDTIIATRRWAGKYNQHSEMRTYERAERGDMRRAMEWLLEGKRRGALCWMIVNGRRCNLGKDGGFRWARP